MLIPKITSYNTKDIPAMYKQGYVLVAIYEDKMFWHRNEQEVYNEENKDKQAMYDKMKEFTFNGNSLHIGKNIRD